MLYDSICKVKAGRIIKFEKTEYFLSGKGHRGSFWMLTVFTLLIYVLKDALTLSRFFKIYIYCLSSCTLYFCKRITKNCLLQRDIWSFLLCRERRIWLFILAFAFVCKLSTLCKKLICLVARNGAIQDAREIFESCVGKAVNADGTNTSFSFCVSTCIWCMFVCHWFCGQHKNLYITYLLSFRKVYINEMDRMELTLISDS